ncbi:ribonucleases P/MRP protein subunit POP1 [Drosophila ficusphila]|uniref:ribonucleases P/MRP protein subunit POP1 n=1 Tax=Drosophila ficusphila TaxID=30025 RepID=UPI0007E81DBB|nr:ribonucleases P/MRP protein subunit POP1 [Drosophila ficusphila]
MSSQKLEYDAAVGGHVTLPTHVTTYHYAAGVLQEIRGLVADCQETTQRSSKLIFQTLPKHMRRRAMSHHPKRLPRKYRQAHRSQMGKGGNQPVNGKRPSRKYRRRPKNLAREYVRRQRRHVWLETHIWHAKRFHMVERWGHRLAFASCDKTYRACYRASAEHCLLQDISFYGCVELRGPLDTLRQGFGRLSSPQCGLGITARTFLSGRREGSVELFEADRYPHGALQRVSFMWRPQKNEGEGQHTVWLWLHPSAAQATLEQLLAVFRLKSTKQQTLPLAEEAEQQADGKPRGNLSQQDSSGSQKPLRFWTQTKAFELQPSYSNSEESLHLVLLQREFNRFRLTGPRAQRVLAASLRSHQGQALQEQEQANYCEAALQLSSPAELLSNLVIGNQVVDPRLQRPSKRTKANGNGEQPRSAADLLVDQPKALPESPLWSKEARERLAKGIMSTHTYELLRRQHAVVPGAPCAFEQQLQAVPVILIQRPGSQDSRYKRLAYGCGWDVIAPGGYGMALWLTLTMWGARPGGLRELDSVAREAGAEMHLPDTIAGIQQAAASADELRARYFRLPPNKRTNYRKLAVASPFSAPWKHLVRDWRSSPTPASVPPFYVLRHRQKLEEIAEAVQKRRPLPEPLPEEALIQIQLRLTSRGRVSDNALICLPTAADYKQRWRQLKQNDQSPVHVEPPQPDLNEQPRKELRQSHKLKLKRLRARRVREKRRLQETATKRVHIRPANTGHLVSAQLQEMCRLWLPSDPAEMRDSVRRQCSRLVFGYVRTAGFSFTEAQVCAVGYVTPLGLQQLINELPKSSDHRRQPPLQCLVRDPDSRDYRWAGFQINLNVASPAF